jgi:hypothetical protein
MATQACTIPGLADLPPGPELGALAALDPATLPDGELLELLGAWSRQHAHAHARMLATIVEVAARSRRTAQETGWESAEIAAALTWTDGKAQRELHFAETLAETLPQVFAAFETGAIDHGKAWTFVDILGCAELTPAQLAAICTAILPAAPSLTTGQIRARLLRAVLNVDPEYRERRYADDLPRLRAAAPHLTAITAHDVFDAELDAIIDVVSRHAG